MTKLTKTQYEKLKPWEKEITNAYKNAFVHMAGSEFNKIALLYAEITGKELTKSQMGCNTCRLNALRKLGELYVNYNKEKTNKGRKPKLDVEETK